LKEPSTAASGEARCVIMIEETETSKPCKGGVRNQVRSFTGCTPPFQGCPMLRLCVLHHPRATPWDGRSCPYRATGGILKREHQAAGIRGHRPRITPPPFSGCLSVCDLRHYFV